MAYGTSPARAAGATYDTPTPRSLWLAHQFGEAALEPVERWRLAAALKAVGLAAGTVAQIVGLPRPRGPFG
ncbi:hypothetical protein ACIBP6_15020 [Nonomuraea terrae]|uniref:hypothetical protein n=1 Tax=Nonomuraea terrae TaxID=2530383 RepID=UPI0037B44C52